MATQAIKWSLPLRFWLLTFPILIALWVANSVGVLQPVDQVGVRIGPWLTSTALAANQTIFLPLQVMRSSYNAYQLVQNLEERSASQQSQLAQLANLQQENQFLRQALASSSAEPPAKIKRLISRVIRFVPLVIDVPVNQALKPSSAVVVQGSLVGRVEVVDAQQARITLLQDSLSQPVVAQVQGTDIQGVVRMSDQQLLFTDFPPESNIPKETFIVTSQQTGIPANLVIGKVAEVNMDQRRQEPVAVLKPLVSIYDSPFVEVWQ